MEIEKISLAFPWSDRTVRIEDRVWHVPFCPYQLEFEDRFSFPGWEHHDLFGNAHPIHVEYCSGNGAWIAANALANPQLNWVAVEKKMSRVKKIWSKIKKHNLSNLLVICGEGASLTQKYFPENSVSETYINFPDPWPKLRHAKNRLIRPDFVNQVWRILKEGSAFTLVTDDPNYSIQMISELQGCAGFESIFPPPYFLNHLENYGRSYFEDLWREKNKEIRYHRFKKIV